MRGLYSLVIRVALPISLYYLIWRGLRQREYFDRWSERFALYRGEGLEGCLWIHAVSVGEVNVAAPLVAALRERMPDRTLLVTTTTPTGSARVRALWGDSVRHVYLPYDLPGAVRNFLDHFQPRLALMMETEIWPNLFEELKARGVPLVIANARLSERSLRGYRPIARLVRGALSGVDVIAAQSDADALRYRKLGAPESVIHVTGNIKYDLPLPEGVADQGGRWRDAWGDRPVWIAASTHPDEEDIVRQAHRLLQAQFPRALLLWAPRHPERFAAVAGDGTRAGFRVASRRIEGLPRADTDIFVIDTLGELMSFFAASDIAFVGGSLQEIGGHNVLEPAALGIPALVGPHTFNFQEITDLLIRAGAVQRVADAASLAKKLGEQFRHPAERIRRGDAGRSRIAVERGALTRTLELLEPSLRSAQAQTLPAC
ncbi:MAG: 3-deoxy-D-manno-octulosonic acid transferase [Gammaproteobacteria bacterium RIFCSPHIGHO2_12_FULL_63_22]|nr:MAG: 3-deoxy-D-manno-octulosonic acid transferase [Gammaproteobacteria bacterium RIFCSPHIGHO2_12_FULL_63_22]